MTAGDWLSRFVELAQGSKPRSVIDTALWLSYLALLVWAAFISGGYASEAWLEFSAVLYAFAAIYCVALWFNASCNLAGLRNARYVIILLFVSLVWLSLQAVLPVENYMHQRLFGHLIDAAWFDPDFKLSLTPHKTRWLVLSNLMILAVFVLSVCLLDRRGRLKQLLVLMTSVGVVHAGCGIFAKFAGLHLVDLSDIDGHFDVARGLFVNRNHFGAFISLCLIGGLCYQIKLALQAKTSPSTSAYMFKHLLDIRTLYSLALAVGLAAIALSQSRAALLGVLIAAVLVLTLTKSFANDLRRRYVIVPLGLLLVGTLAYFGQGLLTRLSAGVFTIGERGMQWSITWQAIKHEPLFGYGGGSYVVVFQSFREFAELRQVIYDQAHNDYLHIWLEQGLIGLGLWLAVISLVIREAVRQLKVATSTLVKAILISSLVVIVAALLQSLVDYNLQILNIRCYLFAIIALVFATPVVNHHSHRRALR